MKTAKNNPAESQDQPSKNAARVARDILGKVGHDPHAVTVDVLKKVGKEWVWKKTYSPDEFDPADVESEFGGGYYRFQVKAGNKYIESTSKWLGAEPPSAQPTEKKPADDDALGGPALVRLLIAQQQSMTQVMCAMIGAQRQPSGSGLEVKDLLPLLRDRSGIGEALEAIRVAQELAPSSAADAPAPAADGVLGVLGQIATAVPAALRELRAFNGSPRPVANTAGKPTAANSENSPSGAAGGPTAEKAGAVPAAPTDATPAQSVSTSAPSERKRLPFPGANAIAARLVADLAAVPADVDPIPAAIITDDVLAAALLFVETEIDLAGAEVLDVLDWYPPTEGVAHPLADALVTFEPKLTRAFDVLARIEDELRRVSKWEAPTAEADDADQT